MDELHDTDAVVDPGTPLRAAPLIPHPPSFSPPMKPVWIIDDDRSIRWVFEKALTRENIAFKTFASAREALAALEDETPQVVVSDIRMPGESGLELLQKAKERYENLPV